MCLRSVAAAEKAVIVLRYVTYQATDLTRSVPYAVSIILLEQLTTARWLHYNTVLLLIPNITVKGCTVLNPATLLPIPGKRKGHYCVVTITEVTLYRKVQILNCSHRSVSHNPDTGKNQVGSSGKMT